MTDRPIIFSGSMVRALLEGRKTMTRRILNPQPEAYRNEYCTRLRFFTRNGRERGDASPDLLSDGTCPAANFAPYQVGDRLYVRENALYWIDRDTNKKSKVAAYQADGYELEPGEVWTPSIHMPRWGSRITLVVTAVKIERLQDISEDDARAEGAPWYVYGHGVISDEEYRADPGYQPNKRMGFFQVWNDLHGWGPPSAWDANPWVVAPTFLVIPANIDSERAAA